HRRPAVRGARGPRPASSRGLRGRGRGPRGRGLGPGGRSYPDRPGVRAVSVPLFALGIVIVGVGLTVSIALHEIGHLVPAKLFGVRVTQYMIGFGPTVWSRGRGESDFGLTPIPLCGYIRLIGTFPPRRGEPAGTIRAVTT